MMMMVVVVVMMMMMMMITIMMRNQIENTSQLILSVAPRIRIQTPALRAHGTSSCRDSALFHVLPTENRSKIAIQQALCTGWLANLLRKKKVWFERSKLWKSKLTVTRHHLGWSSDQEQTKCTVILDSETLVIDGYRSRVSSCQAASIRTDFQQEQQQ